MALVNLMLALTLLAANELAESGYGVFSSTNLVLVLLMLAIATGVAGLCWLVAWVSAPRNAASRHATLNGLAHALIVVLLTFYVLEEPLVAIRGLPLAAYSPTIAYWLVPALAVAALTATLRWLPSRVLRGFFGLALVGALTVALGEAATTGHWEGLAGEPAASETSRDSTTEDRPNVYYLVFDGHAGPPAFPESIEGASAFAERLESDYAELGFETYGLAYSNYFWTTPSLYSIFDNQIHRPPKGLSDEVAALEPNRLFDHVLSMGYEPILYYSDYYEMCGAAAEYSPRCEVYRINNLDSNIPAAQRYPLLLSSILYRCWASGFFKHKKRFFGVANSVGAFDRLIQDLPENRSNRFVFAHIMLPHEPFVIDEECRMRDAEIWNPDYLSFFEKVDPSVAEDRWQRYMPQVSCVHTLVERLITALEAEGIYGDSTIIMHGDHGARISMSGAGGRKRRRKQIPDRYFLDYYSTFFALKRGAFPLESTDGAGQRFMDVGHTDPREADGLGESPGHRVPVPQDARTKAATTELRRARAEPRVGAEGAGAETPP